MLSIWPVEDPSATCVNATQVRAMVDAGAIRWLEAGMPLTRGNRRSLCISWREVVFAPGTATCPSSSKQPAFRPWRNRNRSMSQARWQ